MHPHFNVYKHIQKATFYKMKTINTHTHAYVCIAELCTYNKTFINVPTIQTKSQHGLQTYCKFSAKDGTRKENKHASSYLIPFSEIQPPATA